MIERFDFNNDNEIDFEEFVCIIISHLTRTDNAEEELVTVFKRFDKKNTGSIDYMDLFAVFKELNIDTDEEECKDMIFVIDKSDDHLLQFVEFIEAMTYDVED